MCNKEVGVDSCKGKTVLITGGGSGIGRAAAVRFASEGAAVCIAGRTRNTLLEVAASMDNLSGDVFSLQGDVSSAAGCRTIVEKAVDKTGRIDILVNSAGVWEESPAESVTEEVWDRIIDINLKGTFFMCRYAIPCLKKTEGSIINIGSDSGMIGNSGGAVYSQTSEWSGTTWLSRFRASAENERLKYPAACCGISRDSGSEEGLALGY